MVAYSFKKQFGEPIRSLIKRQTIRADRKRHAREGEQLQLYTGMRTRHCSLIGRATCQSVTPIRMQLSNPLIQISVPYRAIMMPDDLDDFARTDGFEDWGAMKAFWDENHPGVTVFSGVLIRWTDFREDANG